MIDNNNNNNDTVECSECKETYLKGTPINDIISRLKDGKRCPTCLGVIWNWTELSQNS